MRYAPPCLGLCAALALLSTTNQARAAGPGETGRVTLAATPDGGLQPQAACDAEGNVHLVYFKGDPAAGDLFYVKAEPGHGLPRFSEPVRVNSQPGSAVALGTIRGAQLALGRGGRVHVAWNGTNEALPANPLGGSPMLYARSDPAGAAFEPQRNLMLRSDHLDGGGCVAADASGHVYVAWHGRPQGAPEGETHRRFLVTRSEDDGATFTPEAPALAGETGACACCGTRALLDDKGTFYALYRAASGSDAADRDMTLVTSRDGKAFRSRVLQPWHLFACPMSSESLTATPAGVFAAWETKGEVAFARLDPATLEPDAPVKAPGGGERKHPALAVNARGEVLLAWAEGTGWKRGGSLAWRVFDPSGKPTRELGRVNRGVPAWGLPAAVARPDGSFLVIH